MIWNETTRKFEAYAAVEEILEIKTSKTRLDLGLAEPGENLAKFAKVASAGEIDEGYLYVRARAISSRVNKNNDGWPSEELANAYKTFIGRPIFVDHNNDDPRRTRGVIVDSKLHVEDEKTASLDPYYASAPENHNPPTWIEILMEVDAETFPKLAHAIREGHVDAVSMGANIEKSLCSVCANEATTPAEYCKHISGGKGATFEIVADNGDKIQKKAYEDCLGVNFFEESFVFDPADPTADVLSKEGGVEKEAFDWQKFKQLQLSDPSLAHVTDFFELERKLREKGIPEPAIQQVLGDIRTNGWPGKLQLAPNAESEPDFEFSPSPKNNYKMTASTDYSHLIKEAVGSDSLAPDRDINYQPQSEQVTAPQKVDTLRNDITCPNCESDDLGTDPDGILRCPTCGYEQPPEGLDNPDLSRAHDFDLEQDQNEEENQEGDRQTTIVPDDEADGLQEFIAPIKPMTGSATNNESTNGVIDEMIWTRKIKTDDPAKARAFITAARKTAGLVQTTVNYDGGGIHNLTHTAVKNAGLYAVVTYTDQAQLDLVFSDPTAPPREMAEKMMNGGHPINVTILGEGETSSMKDMMIYNILKKNGVSMSQVPISVESDQAETVVALIHSGGASDQPSDAGLGAPVGSKKVITPGSERKGDEPANEQIVADQLKPVEADRRVIKREESPDGTRTEHIVEETGSLGEEDEPKAEEKPKSESSPDDSESEDEGAEKDDSKPNFLKEKEPALAAVNPEKILLAAMTVAEEAVELGIVDANKKMAFIGQLEAESLEEIEARRKTLALVKNAGLSKRGSKVATVGRALPRFAAAQQVPEFQGGKLEDVPLEAVFYS